MTPIQALFGAVCELLEWDPDTLTATAKTRVGKVAKELAEVGATPAQVLYVKIAWPRIWGSGETPTLTDTAIIAWWPALLRQWLLNEKLQLAQLELAAETIDELEQALPLEENRRRWKELMQRGQILKEI